MEARNKVLAYKHFVRWDLNNVDGGGGGGGGGEAAGNKRSPL